MNTTYSKTSLRDIPIHRFHGKVFEALCKDLDVDFLIHAKQQSAPFRSEPEGFDKARFIMVILDQCDSISTGSWLSWAIYHSRKGKRIHVLLPIKADEKWYNKRVLGVAGEVRFLNYPRPNNWKRSPRYGLVSYDPSDKVTSIIKASYLLVRPPQSNI